MVRWALRLVPPGTFATCNLQPETPFARPTMQLTDDLLAGNRRALARTITLVENDGVEAHSALETLYRRTGQAHIIGITGAPGTGKSTLVNALAKAYRQRGYTVGIVAVDPTSPFTGGALLGDRVRIRDLSGDPGIFIRSMATRGSLGGLAQATADVIMVLDSAGFQRLIVETVGVGQAEVDIASTAHTTVVVEAPGMGDEVQAIKAGVLEIADILAVNKADREGADKTITALHMLLGMGPKRCSTTAARCRSTCRSRNRRAGRRRSSRLSPCAIKASPSCWMPSSSIAAICSAAASSNAGRRSVPGTTGAYPASGCAAPPEQPGAGRAFPAFGHRSSRP